MKTHKPRCAQSPRFNDSFKPFQTFNPFKSLQEKLSDPRSFRATAQRILFETGSS